MKKSNYNISTLLNENEYIINNLMTSSIVVLDNNEYDAFIKILDNPDKYKSVNTQLYNFMEREGFLIPDDVNELEIAKKHYWSSKLNQNQLNITIIPTLDCNLDCIYCYQKGSNNYSISEEVALNIYKFIESKISTINYLNISWFGGEPLLQIDFIKKFSLKLIELCNKNKVQYNSSISTNGYLLTKDIVSILKEIKISQINTTLAGTKKFHDNLRYTKEKKNTFDVIVSNIKNASNDINVLVSVNVTKTNIDDLYDFLEFAKCSELTHNISFCFDPVVSYSSNPCDEICLKDKEVNRYVLNLYKYAIDKGLNICDITKFNQNFIYCGADYENSYTVDFMGKVYKCTEFYNEENSIGIIGEDGKFNAFKFQFLSVKDPFNDEVCSKCNILPYCYGGCSTKRRCQKSFCPLEKEFIEEYLKIYYLKYFNQEDIE